MHELNHGLEQWGKENEEHARELDTANARNILSKLATYSQKTKVEREVRMNFSLNFNEMYRKQQTTSAPFGPIYLYENSSTMLLIKACSTQKMCNRISLDTMLTKLGKTLDMVFHWAALTKLLPNYQSKTRAFTLFRNYLLTYHLYLSKEYINILQHQLYQKVV